MSEWLFSAAFVRWMLLDVQRDQTRSKKDIPEITKLKGRVCGRHLGIDEPQCATNHALKTNYQPDRHYSGYYSSWGHLDIILSNTPGFFSKDNHRVKRLSIHGWFIQFGMTFHSVHLQITPFVFVFAQFFLQGIFLSSHGGDMSSVPPCYSE